MDAMPYQVQIADHYDFDFGGERFGKLAAFASKGDAIAYAMSLRTRPTLLGRAARVLDFSKRKPVEVWSIQAD